MASKALTSTAGNFHLAHTAFQAATMMRAVTQTDDERGAVEDIVSPFYARMVEAPADSFTDVRTKLAAIMAEAGTGLVEVEDVAIIARDIEVLLGRVQ